MSSDEVVNHVFEARDPEIGRVLRASTAGFAIGSRVAQLSAPRFGSLVKAQPLDEREAIYGFIYNIYVDDDPLVRRLVLAESPQPSVIEDQRRNRLLPIEMSVLTVGYLEDGKLHGVLQLPHIARPVVVHQQRDGLPGGPVVLSFVALGV